MNYLLDEQHESLLDWLAKNGISESIQLKNSGEPIPLTSLDLYDLCKTVLTCAANPSKPERFNQLRCALLVEVPSDLCSTCDFETKVHMLPKLNPEIDQLVMELTDKVQTWKERVGEAACCLPFFPCCSHMHMCQYAVESEGFSQSKAMFAVDTDGEHFAAKPHEKWDETPCSAKVAGLQTGHFTVTRSYLAIQLIGIIRNTWAHFKPEKVTEDMVRSDFRRDVLYLVLCSNALGLQLKCMKLTRYAATFGELLTCHT